MNSIKKEIKVLSPATVANVVCGFDVFGFALDNLNDQLIMRLVNKKGVKIINKDGFNLPLDPEKNVMGVALLALLEELPEDIGFEIEVPVISEKFFCKIIITSYFAICEFGI